MKKLVLIGAALLQFAVVAPVFAVPCVPQTLAQYILLGVTGCTVDGVDFSDFTEVDAALLPPDAIRIAATAVMLTPITDASGLGFSLSSATPLVDNAGGQFLELFFGFTATPAPSRAFSSNTITLDSSAVATGAAAITIVEDKCLNGSFSSPISGCSGTGIVLIAFARDGISELSQNATFPAASFFDVFVDLVIDGGPDPTTGQATLGPTLGEFRLTQVGAAVPEPASWALLLIALLALSGLRWLPHSLTRADPSTWHLLRCGH
ncbi:MAG: PEP-CTERM sorting domain-containing protein [Casimicrobiaceae bacterium]